MRRMQHEGYLDVPRVEVVRCATEGPGGAKPAKTHTKSQKINERPHFTKKLINTKKQLEKETNSGS